METKIRNFLQSDFFILSIALLLGLLCHFFVATEIVASDKKLKNIKTLYASVFDFNPLIGERLQSFEHSHMNQHIRHEWSVNLTNGLK